MQVANRVTRTSIIKVMIAAVFAAPTAASAQATNQTNIETMLDNLVEFMTGPIAVSAGIIAIVLCGYMLISGNGNKGLMITVILGIIVIFSASWLVTTISGTSV
jgi:type IV secretion system protein VirB2